MALHEDLGDEAADAEKSQRKEDLRGFPATWIRPGEASYPSAWTTLVRSRRRRRAFRAVGSALNEGLQEGYPFIGPEKSVAEGPSRRAA